MSDSITLHYHRPPDRTDVFVQELLYRDGDVLISYNPDTHLSDSMYIDGQRVLDPGSPVIWFMFPGARFDVGRFHTADGAFTGIYSDIVEPVQLENLDELKVTDLFVDVWAGVGRAAMLLDVDELERAVANAWVTQSTASIAIAEAERLIRLSHTGEWPPAIVNEWTLERVRQRRT